MFGWGLDAGNNSISKFEKYFFVAIEALSYWKIILLSFISATKDDNSPCNVSSYPIAFDFYLLQKQFHSIYPDTTSGFFKMSKQRRKSVSVYNSQQRKQKNTNFIENITNISQIKRISSQAEETNVIIVNITKSIILVENGPFDYPPSLFSPGSTLDETFLSALNENFKEISSSVKEALLINWMARSL